MMQTNSYTTFLVLETMQYDVLIPYHLVLLPNPSYVVSAQYRENVLQPSFEASAAPFFSPPYHRYPQYPSYVPPTHYSLPEPPHLPIMVPTGQRRANIPPRQRRANIPPKQRRGNIPPRQRWANMSVLQGDEYGAAPLLLYVDRVQPQPSDEAEVMTLEVNEVTQSGGNTTARHALESRPSIVLSWDHDAADCVICMDEMCTQDEAEITKLPCDHLFHKNCIGLWLNSNNTCPLCRFKLPIDETTNQA
ncbi:E3 ubiquitin-protein ligase RING1-like protein [Carex littledalei]|uniref:E3 ubiquitin-protein ligase RING1-like protein n=1 Tax=Carex littledalei TaxID=544730 RepID=A0A833RH30_9POAL|nr:E3 ubiquitin-protein ligase RING1-like protein [Carex littledalei]